MSKAGDIAKVSAKGSFNMLWGLVVSTVIGSVGMIFIARLLGSDQYGLYTVVITVPLIIQIFRDWGMNSAMVKFTAQYRAEGRVDEIRSVYLTGILFEVVVGLALSLFSFFFADFLATLSLIARLSLRLSNLFLFLYLQVVWLLLLLLLLLGMSVWNSIV